MEDEPCGLLSDAESPGHFVGADAIAAIHEHPQSDEPFVESDRGILENGSELYGELLVALFALPAPLGL